MHRWGEKGPGPGPSYHQRLVTFVTDDLGGVGSRDFVLIDSVPGTELIAAETCKPTPPEVCQQSRGRAAGTGWGGSPTPTVHALEASMLRPHERHLAPELSSSCSVHPCSIVNVHGTMLSRKLAACCMCTTYDGFRRWMRWCSCNAHACSHCIAFCVSCRKLGSRFKRSILEYVILAWSLFSW